jgi:hypothetical protein
MIDGNADHQRLQIVSVVTDIAYYRSNTLFKSAHSSDNKITYVMPLRRIGRVTKFTITRAPFALAASASVA